MCFTSETKGTYYVPYSNNPKTLARGKIWNQFNDHKKVMKKLHKNMQNLDESETTNNIVIHTAAPNIDSLSLDLEGLQYF